MSTFWLIYLITTGVIILLTALVSIFFKLDGEEFSISYIVLTDFLGAIPGVNVLVCIVLVILLIIGMCDGDLDPKY